METVKGFRDFTGEEAEKREIVRKTLAVIFEEYGFEPAETPIIEYRKFVQGDNINDEAVSDIFKLKDRGERDLALRYEFTFQLKRLMKGKKLPYKRYQIGPVFRDEPVSENRLRQFTQCDIDLIGASIKDEAEILAIAKRALSELKIDFTIMINNRKLMNEIMEKEEIDKSSWESVIREVDKMDKFPEKEVYNNLKKYNAEKLISIFKKPEKYFEKYISYKEIKELKKICSYYKVRVKFLPSLARGLSYYNGNVFEVKSGIKETVAAGGSYIFEGVQSTGISFGLDRLTKIAGKRAKRKKLLILSIGEDKKAIELSERFKGLGISCILSFSKISKALDYANAKKIDYVVFIGEEEVKKKAIKLRDMSTGKELYYNTEELILKIENSN